jgi:hypothetical protein
VAGVAQEPAKTQPGQFRDSRDQPRGIRPIRIDPAAVESDVDFHEHVDHGASAAQRRRPLPRHVHVVDNEGEMCAVEQREHAIGVDRMERVGKADIVDAGGGKDLRFAELGAADADCAAPDLPPRHLRQLVRFGVRPEPNAARIHRGLHAVDVARDACVVDKDGRGAEIRNSHALSVRENREGIANSSIADCRLQTAGRRLQIADCRLQIADCGLRIDSGIGSLIWHQPPNECINLRMNASMSE